MYKQFLSIILFLIAIQAQSQNIYFQKDTLNRWRIVQENYGKEPGQGTVTYTPYLDSAAAVASFLNFMQIKRDYIDAKSWDSDWKVYDDLLQNVTGKGFDDIKKEELALSLIGDWKLITGADTMKININSFLTVSGAEINGKIEPLNNKSILMKRVLPVDTKFIVIAPGQLEGTINTDKIKLIKNE